MDIQRKPERKLSCTHQIQMGQMRTYRWPPVYCPGVFGDSIYSSCVWHVILREVFWGWLFGLILSF